MRENIQTQSLKKTEAFRKHPVRVTALLYLREALLENRYEECPELIKIALEFGAENLEIVSLLEPPRRELG